MKRLSSVLHYVLLATTLVLHGLTAQAVTFTNDTAISFTNTNYDGLDIIVTNCTLTVDGAHAFASLQVLNAGNLTHTYAPGGTLEDRRSITNEPQVLSTTNLATLSNANVVDSSIVVQDLAGLVTYTNGVDYLTGVDTNGMTTLLLTTSSAIADGSTNLVSYDVLDTPVAAGLSLTVTGDVTVALGGTINADGTGFGGGLGHGAGTSSGNPSSGSGAGHGGYGGSSAALNANGVSYDSIQQPTELGSGGGAGYAGVGGAGGGRITLVVGGIMRVDGTVTANGADGVHERSGGGSGGSIWVRAHSFTGSGVLSANGGAGEPAQGGGGGGGRISVWYDINGFLGSSVARGGSGYVYGGAGTIYTQAKSTGLSSGRLLVDNGGTVGATTPLSSGETFDLIAQGGAMISWLEPQLQGNLLVASNAWINVSGQLRFWTIAGNATIQAGGGIIADGAGYAGGQGPGAGRADSYAFTGGGGGYGGYGAMGGASATSQPPTAYGGTPYGSIIAPRDMGSGGGSYAGRGVGGAGGGSIQLTVTGTLMLDGRISADGSPGLAEGGGGGSGGSIALTVGTLTGGGTISANGGMGNGFGSTGGGGGGGGRIAIQYGGYLFFGATTARGGSGSAWGGAGTIYTKANNQPWGQVLADNGGQTGTNTTWSQASTIDLTVRGGAVVVPPSAQAFGTLLVASNGWLRITNQTLTVTGNATVQAGGGIIADSAGYAPGSGPGAGKYVSGTSGYIGGGGGYGGYGAVGAASTPSSLTPYGGTTYGSLISPTDFGSGGGSYSSTQIGGAGGGAIRLTVEGVLQVYGAISAAGGAAISPNGGGGSGGTILLTVGTLTGSGVIAANGGTGNYSGGGGGGGRIAINYGTYDFTGLVSACGGGGYATGGAGTIYTKGNKQSALGQVLVDNGGQGGTNTTFGTASLGAVDLTVRNGAVLSPPRGQIIGTLMVASNGWVSISNQTFTVTGNATVQEGGGIIADGTGSPAGQGQGAGRYEGVGDYGFVGGGGGYGGYGASGGGTAYAYGGSTYGSATEPTASGSGGGGPYRGGSLPVGGAGGGAIGLTVAGTLQVDGRISAFGLAGGGASTGGGSGGGINLRVGTLTGSGAISANGGAGNYWGGGGGGGRIAVVYATNHFSGLMSAYGGAGYRAGGAGTIYTRPATLPAGGNALVVVDNGGQAGTNTSWAAFGTVDLTVSGGAVVAASTPQTAGNLIVASNGWVFLTATQGLVPMLTITRDATVQAGGGIIADGTGYPAGQRDGAGKAVSTPSGYVSSGGGYGGNGGSSGGSVAAPGGSTYGSATQPASPGSGGGAYSTVLGGAGGGGIRLNVAGTLQVDGRISAAGGAAISPNFGGGSGGSIWLTAATLAGAGVISANGGAGNGLGGGGGGGRIALQYSTNVFLGVLSAFGGGGYTSGGAGTIYTKANSQPYGQLLVDNDGHAGTNTSWTESSTLDLTVKGGAIVALSGGRTFGNLLVGSNGWISLTAQLLTVTGNATVQAGGGIIADGTGFPSGQGPGAGKYSAGSASGYVGGGGGHGGYGAASGGAIPGLGGSTYGSVTGPTDAGSGGGGGPQTSLSGGAGGGAIHVTVTGVLLVNGRVSANGGAGNSQGSGGGSGGSVWLTAGTLAGDGIISANGGTGNELGGGGGGGYVSLQYGANAFSGTIIASGGGGYAWGGAGTIYTKANSQATGQVLVDNSGNYGTITPVPYLSPFDLTVRGGAIVYPSGPNLILSNLFINAGGYFTCAKTQTNLDVAVLHNAVIDASGLVAVDGKGYAAGTGPGAGLTRNSIGSGAGYGGNGGASSVLPGGTNYGSIQQPVDRGSGGGFGYGTPAVGSEGGGAIRLTVGGTLTLNGTLSAEGNAGLQDDAGGGSGGSVWLTAGALAGSGSIMADGGAGELYGGGGGGGGRIAIHTPFNGFGGLVSVAGGAGASSGQTGSVFYDADPPAPQVVSSAPVGSFTAAVSSAEIVFSTPVNPYSVAAPNVGLTAPGGVPVSGLAVTSLSPYRFQISFPAQTAQGDYTLTVGPQVQDLSGQPMSQVYTSTFSIIWEVVQGSITDSNGLPVSGVLLQPDGGVQATITDADGNYVLSVPPSVTINVVPSKSNLVFVPSSRSYANVTTSISNENYLAVSTVAPALTTQVQTNMNILSWYGIRGVTYQPLYSTNLVDWLPYGLPVPGTNGLLQLLVPIGTDANMFFRVGASY